VVNLLEAFAQKNNIIIGACHAAPLEEGRLTASPFVPFVSRDFARRTDPARTLKNANLIIVIGIPHEKNKTEGALPLPPHEGKPPLDPVMRHTLSSLGTSVDYHRRAKVLLRELVEELGEWGKFEYKILVDSPALDERAIAHRAGLGFFGKNKLLISQKFGSRLNIGCLVISTQDKVFAPLFSKSGWGVGQSPTVCNPDCDLCIKACPTGALGGDSLATKRCVSYLTQKDELTAEEEKMIRESGQIYGCDICQNACPFNEKETAILVNVQEWLEKTDEEFQEQYGETAMLWRGAEILRRNARVLISQFDILCYAKQGVSQSESNGGDYGEFGDLRKSPKVR
jgi:epoxyqueuosine reductase